MTKNKIKPTLMILDLLRSPGKSLWGLRKTMLFKNMPLLFYLTVDSVGFLFGSRGKKSARQCRRFGRRVWSLGWEAPWTRKWQPTPVFLPGKWTEEPGGLQSWSRKESDMTEWLTTRTNNRNSQIKEYHQTNFIDVPEDVTEVDCRKWQ